MITQLAGSLYMAMADHFINNTFVNVIHVISSAGAEEFMVARIAIVQSLSFVIALIGYFWVRVAKNKEKGLAVS